LQEEELWLGPLGLDKGHSLETHFNQIDLKKQKGKSSLRSLTFGHLKDEGTNCMIH